MLRSHCHDYQISRGVDLASDQRGRAEPALLMEGMLAGWLHRDPTARQILLEIDRVVHGSSAASGDERELAVVLARLKSAFRHGHLVALRVVHASWSAGLEPAAPMPGQRSASPKPLTWFEVTFVDEIGEPVADLEVFFGYGETRQRRTTSASGRARVDDVDASSASVSPVDLRATRQLLKPRWDTVRGAPLLALADDMVAWRLAGAGPRISLQSERPRTVSIRPSVTRARLMGGFFETSKCFLLPGGVDGIRGIVRTYGDHEGATLLIVGHTDTAGDPAYNDALAQERAEATAAYLTDDVEGWYRWYGSGVAAEKRWGAGEDQLMLAALPDAGERAEGEGQVRWFQRTRGLTVDGIAGSETRHALIGEYMALDGTSLPRSIELVTHGCGENFPREDAGDGQAEPDNRRIEVFFFADGHGVQPPPPGERSAPGSLEYGEWLARAGEPIDFSAAGTQMRLELEWSEEMVELLPPDLEIVLSGPRLVSQTRMLAQADRDDGLVKVSFDALDRGQVITLVARHGKEELVLVRDQVAGDLELAMVWEHPLEELVAAAEPEAEDAGDLVASAEMPDDVRGGSAWA